MLRKRGQKGFTLIELLIVIAIIGILAAIAVPIYRAQTTKARLTELTNTIAAVATAGKNYYEENPGFNFATLNGRVAFENTMGISLPFGGKYIQSIQVATLTGVITVQAQATGESLVDNSTITLSPNTSQGGIRWYYGGNMSTQFMPKN